MKSIFFGLLFISFFCQAQDTISISVKDLSQAMGGNYLPSNAVFNSDPVLSKTIKPNIQTITAKLSKFNNAFLVLSKTDAGFIGRFIKDSVYYELTKISAG